MSLEVKINKKIKNKGVAEMAPLISNFNSKLMCTDHTTMKMYIDLMPFVVWS